MHESVAIVGGGIAGLSAAHELMERGFRVHVYERRAFFGGKAASGRVEPNRQRATVPGTGTTRSRTVGSVDPAVRVGDETAGPPGEHGFRFFPGWYRHLTDTMARIPYHKPGGGRVTVADNLISARANMLAWFDRPPVIIPLRLPSNRVEASNLTGFLTALGRLGLTGNEIKLFSRKMLEFAMLPDDRREEQFEAISWWEYLECDDPARSRAYKDLVRATTQTTVAARAEEASAYSVGRLVMRTLLESLSSVDRVLNGPSSEVWIGPWVDYLRSRGVTFHAEMELDSVEFDAASRTLDRIVMLPVPISDVRRLRRQLTRIVKAQAATQRRPQYHDGSSAVSPAAQESRTAKELRDSTAVLDRLRDVVGSLQRSEWLQARCGFEFLAILEEVLAVKEVEAGATTAERLLEQRQLLARVAELGAGYLDRLSELEADPANRTEVAADYFVLALPLEQLAYYVNRSAMLRFLAPELRDVIPLSRHMDWMAGIQFYLRTSLDVARGHIIGLDSTWALTAVEHTQFWKDIALPRDVKAVLSVDIAAWNKRGLLTRKEAFNCSGYEIAQEVWFQLKAMLNKVDLVDVLRDDMLLGGQLTQDVSYHLDDNIVDLSDRKKQAFYERARGVRFNTLELLPQGNEDETGTWEDGYMWGPRRLFNVEPLLINRAGSRSLRPEARTSITNLFLAGDFIKTETDLACMEGANEAARRAVNGILDATASPKDRCNVWPFSPPRQAIEAVLSLARPVRALRGIAAVISQTQDRIFHQVAGGLLQLQARLPAGRSRTDDDQEDRYSR